MPTTMLGLLGVLLCALAVSSDVTPQPDFNIKRMAGKWYLIGIANSDEWFVNCKAGLKMGVAMLTPTDEGDLEMAYSSLNPDGTCWRINQFVTKSDFPGIFSFNSKRWETYKITFVDVKYDEYVLIHTVKTKDGSTTVVSKLYGRTPDLSQVVLDKFTMFSWKQGILSKNIAILTKKGFDHQQTAEMLIAGGWSPVTPVTPEVMNICLKVKSDIEANSGTNFAVYIPLSFASQIVAGVNYVVKVKVGEDKCVHAMIFQELPCYGGDVTVNRVQYPKSLNDPLIPF
ncbi:lipocalin-like isoform X1 [Chanodichthys erythropterus]|uniref:lipocalin-like isoform X1 n=1 Tax=Chanodichthys erythropterus TaxID=933992 RepID=UPI00351E03D7